VTPTCTTRGAQGCFGPSHVSDRSQLSCPHFEDTRVMCMANSLCVESCMATDYEMSAVQHVLVTPTCTTRGAQGCFGPSHVSDRSQLSCPHFEDTRVMCMANSLCVESCMATDYEMSAVQHVLVTPTCTTRGAQGCFGHSHVSDRSQLSCPHFEYTRVICMANRLYVESCSGRDHDMSAVQQYW
jgi:hypothetical protein